MNHYRQGDVLAVEVKSIPSRARELPRDKHNRIVLAEGEKTGHAHTIKDKGVCSFTTLNNADIEFMLVGGGGALSQSRACFWCEGRAH